MSGVILSTIFDFGLEAKLRLLQEEAAGILKKSNKDGNANVVNEDDDEAEVGAPEILPWIKSREEDVETGRRFSNSVETDSGGEEGESVDSDSDTIRNEYEEDYEDEEGSYYEGEDNDNDEDEDGSGEEGIFEWEMTTILEEPEEEEAAEYEERRRISLEEESHSEANAEGIDLTQEKGVSESDAGGAGGMERGIPLLFEENPASAQGETGISTDKREAAGESGTPAEEKGSWASTSADDHHDSPSVDSEEPPECPRIVIQPCTASDEPTTSSDLEQCPNSSGSETEGKTVSVLQDLEVCTTLLDKSIIITEQSHHNQESLESIPGQAQENNSNSSGEEIGMHSTQHQRLLVINNNGTDRLRSVLRKPGNSKGRKGRCVTFNESLNLFYDAECSCWVHEDDYARQVEFERREREELYQYEPLPLPVEYDEPPTLSPPEGYKDRFFPQEFHCDPDVTRVSPPSPPTARRKVFLRDPTGGLLTNGQEEEPEEETNKKKGLRLGGILKGGRLWRSNSSDGKKVISPPEEPDVVKCTESSSIQTTNSYSTSTNTYDCDPSQQQQVPTKVSIGTAPLRTSEQIRLAVNDSTLRSRKNKKPECSTLVEKLRWLTSLEDEDSDSNQSGFATWPSPRDKNGLPLPPSSSSGNPTRKSDAGTSTSEEHFVQSNSIRLASGSIHEAKIKQISYTLEDIEEGLKGTELELESFITKDGGRMERIRKRYGEDGGDDYGDYGFSRRPSVKGIKPKFSSTNQIFAQFTNRKSMESPALGMSSNHNHVPGNNSARESEYENTRLPAPPPPVSAASAAAAMLQANNQPLPPPPPQGHPPESDPNPARTSLSYEFQNAPGRQTDESRAHFEMIRQSFESATSGGAPNFITNYNRPHSWSVSTLPHPHHNNHTNNTLPTLMSNHHHHLVTTTSGGHGIGSGGIPSGTQGNQPLYGTVRRVPNVIGRPLFLHYGALSVEAHPNKIPYPTQQAPNSTAQVKIPETPSPTQQTPVLPVGMRYYGPPIRYYNQPPPVPPRTVTAAPSSLQGQGPGVIVPAPVPIGINNLNMPPSNPANHTHPHVNVMAMNEAERGVPEGATDEEHLQHKEAYSMNV